MTRVVLVEPADRLREPLAEFLRLHRFEVHAIDSAEAAVDTLAHLGSAAAVVVLGVSLPTPSTSDVLRRLAASPLPKRPFVILVAANPAHRDAVGNLPAISGQLLAGPGFPERLLEVVREGARRLSG